MENCRREIWDFSYIELITSQCEWEACCEYSFCPLCRLSDEDILEELKKRGLEIEEE